MTHGFDADQHDQGNPLPDDQRLPEEQELLNLLSAMCESRATEEEVSRLQSLLQSRPEYIERYVSYMDMHGAMHWQELKKAALELPSGLAGGSASADLNVELTVSTQNILSILEEEAEVAQREAVERAHIENLASEKLAAFRQEQDRNRRPEPVAASQNSLYTMVSSLAAAAILFIFWMLPDPVPVEPTPVFVASIDDSIDASWSDPSLSTAPGTQLFTLENLVLTRGVVQIGFERGAKMIVEAPATLELLSTDSARLEWGKLVGHVPHNEMQLTIKTPQASITDLGTEFGVEVNRQQVTHLHVFEGSVSAATLDAEGKTAQQRTVLVDEAVYLQPKTGAIEPAPAAAADRFVRRILHPVLLQNPTATFSQHNEPRKNVRFLLDPNPKNAWAIGAIGGMVGSDNTAVLETVDDAGFADGTMLTFVLEQLSDFGQTNLGRFRLSLTTDDRSEFADGLAAGGDVTANWTVLTPLSFVSRSGATLTKLADHSLLVSGENPATDVYTVTARTHLTGITGFRLEVLADPSLPSGGPGRHPDGNFHLTTFIVNAALASDPAQRLPVEGNNSTNR